MIARFLLVLALAVWPTLGWAAVERPPFTPTLGAQVDLATRLVDSTGTTKTLAQFIGGRTALVLFGYHDCPNQCGIAQQVVAATLGKTGLAAKVAPLFITLAPEEGPTDAAGAKSRLAAAIGPAAAQWQFLSGPDVERLGDQFGIGAIERARIRQYVHPVAVYTLTPDGRVSHVLPGLDLGTEDLRLALVEASNNQLGNVIDHIVLWCSGYDPTTGRYTPIVIAGLRIGGIVTVVLGLAALAYIEIRKRRWVG